MTTMTKATTGVNYLRDAMIGANMSDGLMTYISLGVGTGVLSTAITNGSTGNTTLHTAAGLTKAVLNGESLTLVNSSGVTQVVTAAAPASIGATSITTTSFTATATFGIGSGIVATPAAGDTGLDDETFRNSVTALSPGGAGEALIVLFVGSSDVGSSVNFVEAAVWGTPADGTLNSGTFIGRCVIFYAYTAGVSADNLEFDLTIS